MVGDLKIKRSVFVRRLVMYHYPMFFFLLFLAFIKHLPVYYDSFFFDVLMCVENFYHSYVMQFFSFSPLRTCVSCIEAELIF